MGMAASQARLLSLTSRMADNELRAQIANNAKMRLAADSSRISADYVNALNNATMMITNYNEAGDSQFNKLTFNKLTQYSPFNTQYGLANTYGQLLVNENEAKIFEAAGGSLSKFLAAHGLEFTTSYFSSEAFNGASSITFDDEKGNNLGDFTLDELKAMYFGGTTNMEGMAVNHNGYMDNIDMYDSFQSQTEFFAGKYQQAQQDENIMNLVDQEIYAFKDSSSYLSKKEQVVQELRKIYADSSDFEKAGITEGNGANKLAQVLTLISDMSVDTDGESIITDKKIKGATNDYYSSIVDYYFKTVERTDESGNTVQVTELKELEDFDFRRRVVNGKTLVEEGRTINDQWVAYTQPAQTVGELRSQMGITGTNYLNFGNIEDTWSAWDGALWKTNYLWHDEPAPNDWADKVFGTINDTNTYAIKVVDSAESINKHGISAHYDEGLPRGYVYLSKDSDGNLKFMYGQNNSDQNCSSYCNYGGGYSRIASIAGENKHFSVYELDIHGQCNGLTVEYDDTLTYLLETGEGLADRSKQYDNVTEDGKIYSRLSTNSLANISRETLESALATLGAVYSGEVDPTYENRCTIKAYFDTLAQYEVAKNLEVHEEAVTDEDGNVIVEQFTQDQKDELLDNIKSSLVSFMTGSDDLPNLIDALDAIYGEGCTDEIELNSDGYLTQRQLESVVGCSADAFQVLDPTSTEDLATLITTYMKLEDRLNQKFQWLKDNESLSHMPMYYGIFISMAQEANKIQDYMFDLQDALIAGLDALGYRTVELSETMENAFVFTDRNNSIWDPTNNLVEYHNFAWTEITDIDGDNPQQYFIVDPDGYYISYNAGESVRDASRTNNMQAYSFGDDGKTLKQHSFFSVEQAYFYIIQDLVQDAFGQYDIEKAYDANGNEIPGETVVKDQRGNFRYTVNLMDYIDDPSFKVDPEAEGARESNATLQALRDQKDKIERNFGINLADVESVDFAYVGSYIYQLLENIRNGEYAPEGSAERRAAEAAKAIYDNYILNCLFDVYGEPNVTWIDKNNPTGDAEAKVNWYTNLFQRMSKGYKVLEDGLANSNEWIQFALESGLCTIEQVDTNNGWYATPHSNVATITEVTDDVAVARAEAEYKKAMNEIEKKDKRLDIELKNIDTEHNSLQAEYDSVKNVISKNIERTFKMYS